MIARGLAILFGAQALGWLIVHTFHLGISDSVFGLVLLLGALLVRGSIPDSVARASELLIKLLLVLFVPASVGLGQYFGLLERSWLPLFATIGISLVLTMIVTSTLARVLERRPAADPS